jgi:glycogen debranching enzyme
MENFAESEKSFHYLRRTIIIWGDLIKLRYGRTKKDSPALWKRMKIYVQ